ncbi:GTP cyclohydrolase 1 feedback regulatory protein-like isoform X1 [Asterias rubens]|uniref:GTP cyclohydrolase 1 feedback regulatory protein-like isoform X1 n=1 Tax=Asterias rubens TaxID=7604 RepID=UPI001455704E|nr:GTP cyclohydrolase 1 feedback regulatory protein-like isoform X1 [Asterias rubens]
MPYIFVSTQIRLECGPTICGDEHSDPELMNYLGAKLVKQMGNNFKEYCTEEIPRLVLNKLERRGYRVVSQSGAGQTMIWTLRKPDTSDSNAMNGPGSLEEQI